MKEGGEGEKKVTGLLKYLVIHFFLPTLIKDECIFDKSILKHSQAIMYIENTVTL